MQKKKDVGGKEREERRGRESEKRDRWKENISMCLGEGRRGRHNIFCIEHQKYLSHFFSKEIRKGDEKRMG